jgi:hypothetical protein
MTYDASNRKDIRKAEKRAAEVDRARAEFLRHAMSTTAGRLWFHDLLTECGVFRVDPTFDPHRDYFLLGIRNIGLRIFAEIQATTPDLYILMEQEAYARSIADTVRDGTDRSAGPGRGEYPGSPNGGWNDPGPDADISTPDPDLFDPGA